MPEIVIKEKIDTLIQLGINLKPSEIKRLRTAKNDIQLDNIARSIIDKKFD